ncbi:MAG: phosphoribosyltransferase, partial [Anaerolineae bacterium]|nr:phosphoribosyltransferase [Anaerolineae bacterium]
MIRPYFRDRRDAGEQLAEKLPTYRERPGVIVLALPRGGVPVGFAVAEQLGLPLDIFLVRKLGVPGREELAMGAIASGGVRVLNQEVVGALNIPDEVIDAIAGKEQRELERRERAYRGDRPRPDLTGLVCLLVDDGLATGASMQAAVAGVRAHNPREIVVAVPTAAPDTCALFEAEVDHVVCAVTPEPFFGVGLWYEDFSQTTDDEVRHYLKRAR